MTWLVADRVSPARTTAHDRTGARLAIVGIGVSLLTYGAAMAEPRLPAEFIAAVILLALLCMAPVVSMVREVHSRPPADTAEHRWRLDARMLADRCHSVARSLETFRDECRQVRPRRHLLSRAPEARMGAWRKATVDRYQREYRAWTTEVFDDLCDLEMVFESDRSMITNPTAAQIEHLPEYFESAARRLERTAR